MHWSEFEQISDFMYIRHAVFHFYSINLHNYLKFLHGSMWFEYCQSSSSYPLLTKHKHTGHSYPLYPTEYTIHYTQSDYNLGFFCPIIALLTI